MTELILITGGVKSGKSQLAMRCLSTFTSQPCLLATARRTDDEMSQRIDRHIADRGQHWQTIETPLALPEALEEHRRPLLVDCLGVWLTNILVEQPHQLESRRSDLLTALRARAHPTVLVTNESGLGVIGANALTRRFIDELGLMNQAIAQQASHVALSVVGIPQWLKGQPIT